MVIRCKIDRNVKTFTTKMPGLVTDRVPRVKFGSEPNEPGYIIEAHGKAYPCM